MTTTEIPARNRLVSATPRGRSDSNPELTGDLLDSVEVRLRASPGIIHRLGSGDVSAQIDLAGATEGERIVHLTPTE